ncbi:hypothetical protein NLM31_07610 [Bradyrhizobium sp. CCGUVB4N]|uniref:hypothetical protein n=1 Tax=Bradyrhizobium sp. CCGUVB4N TaxID=2949631 RepID=UPI0020B1D31F|nr:hypothetical protein [Bradyrhizobium sp. CCGUVB4N]MCP3380260.1 hypothetical protein [Bradyrhizobium sp. CCGUVB4N]
MTSVINLLQVSRFLQVYDQAAAQMHIRLSIGFDFHEYVSITRATPTKVLTSPNFRPDRSPIKSGEGYWIIGVDKNDEVAVLEAGRLYNLSHSNFAEHLESLKAFYADPSIHEGPKSTCTCIAPSAKKMTGKVAYHGDLWVRSDFRGKGITKIMRGIERGVSLAMWAPDFSCAIVARWTLEKAVHEVVHQELGGSIQVEQDKVQDYWLIWLTGEELRNLVNRHDAAELLLELSSSTAPPRDS